MDSINGMEEESKGPCIRWRAMEGYTSKIALRAVNKDKNCFQPLTDEEMGFCECKSGYRINLEKGEKLLNCDQLCTEQLNYERKIPRKIIQIFSSPILPERIKIYTGKFFFFFFI